MKFLYSDNINGILGTVIFHLFLILFFLIVRIGDVKKKHIEYFPIDFEDELKDIEEILKEIENEPVEIDQLSEEVRKNIAVNIANKLNEEISTENYIEELKEELDIENLEQHLDRNLPEQEDIYFNDEQISDNEEESDSETEYTGPTNVTYFLENRFKIYLPIPVYTCKGGGLVVINIGVNQKGNVIHTSVSNDSDTDDRCLIETALKYANRTRFNIDYNAESRQNGYIMYQFIPQ